MAPTNSLNQSEFHPAYTIPCSVMPKMSAPTDAPNAEP